MVTAGELVEIMEGGFSEMGQIVNTPEKVLIPDEEDEGMTHVTCDALR